MLSYGERDYTGTSEAGFMFTYASFYQGRPLQLLVEKDGRQLFYGAPKDSPWTIGVCEAFPYERVKCNSAYMNPADSSELAP